MLYRSLLLLLFSLLVCNKAIAQADGYGPPPQNSDSSDEQLMPPPKGERRPAAREGEHRPPRDKKPIHQGGPRQAQQGDGNHPPRQRRQGPPPEAFEACKDALLGEEVQIQTPRGHKIDALCDYVGDDLVAIPLHFFEPEQPE